MWRRGRWPPPPAISPRGRWAGVSTGCGLVIAGVGHAAGSWDELTSCSGLTIGTGPAQVGSQQLCDVVGGVAGLWFLMSAGLAVVGGVILWAVLTRPARVGGGDGWTWGWGAIAAVGGAIAVTRVPNHTCPDGFTLDELFALCIGVDDRFAAASNIPLKGALAVCAVLLGLVLARVRWIPAAVASAVALGLWLAGMGWFLLDTVGGDVLARGGG